MFLTRFQINPARRGAVKLLGSPQAMHAAILAGFPPDQEQPCGRVLWRADRSGHRVALYVVSPDKPDFTHLVEQAGWPTTEAWATRGYDELLASLRDAQTWGFRLTANPTRSTRLVDGGRSQRLGHVTAAQQRQWLLDRAASWGMELVEDQGVSQVVVSSREMISFRRGADRVTLSRATFDGRLIVTDVDRLRHALTAGIGPAKAYGCGLMTLAPVAGGG